jgi:hypothetical protein
MSTRHNLVTVCEGICPETGLTVSLERLRIGFTYYPGCRETHEQPAEDETAEFHDVSFANQPHAPVPELLRAWAEEWLSSDAGQTAAFELVSDWQAAGEEWKAEQRADMWRFA